MGFLLGLPLRLLGLIFGLIRFLIPLVLLVLVGCWLWRKYGGHRPSDEAKKDEPHFKGRYTPWITRKLRTTISTRSDHAEAVQCYWNHHPASAFAEAGVVPAVAVVLEAGRGHPSAHRLAAQSGWRTV